MLKSYLGKYHKYVLALNLVIVFIQYFFRMGLSATPLDKNYTITSISFVDPPTCYENYKVVSGDYCSKIATSYGLSTDQFLTCNPGLVCANLQIDQSVCANCFKFCDKRVKVKSGDSCWAIADGNGLTLDQLYECNPAINCDALQIDQQVCISCVEKAKTTTTTVLNTPTSTPSAKTCYENHTIVSGDTCWDLSVAAGLTLSQFQDCNPGIVCANLQIGQVVCMNCLAQCDKRYKVKSGDGCYAIASANGLTLDQLKSCNPGINCDNLQIDQQVCIACDKVTPRSTKTISFTTTTKKATPTVTDAATTVKAPIFAGLISALLATLFPFFF